MYTLSPEQLDLFINEVNDYDSNILDLIHFDPFHEIIGTIVQSLREYNLYGRKCYLCLLNYVFQRIGRLDLAIEIRLIWNTLGRATPALD